MLSADALEGLLTAFPRVQLGAWPTPLGEYGSLLIKHDDINTFTFGGNKLRNLEYYFAQALDAGAATVVTIGSPHSNHARLTAAAAAQLGLNAIIIVVADEAERDVETLNKALIRQYGARLTYVNPDTARDEIDAYFASLDASGEAWFKIPAGGHGLPGAHGYLQAALELVEQIAPLDPPDRIVMACGTGTTYAGIALGCRLRGLTIPVWGVSVARPAQRCRDEIYALMEQICEHHELELPLTRDDLLIDESRIGDGYAAVPDFRRELVDQYARERGLLIDPIYMGRALEHALEAVDNGERVLLYHSGGVCGLLGGLLAAPPAAH